MASLKIRIRNMDKLRKAFRTAPNVVVDEVNKGIHESIADMEGVAKRKSPVDTGRLRSSHRTRFGNLSGELFPTVDYAVFVHEGTKPHWPPFGANRGVSKWARRKGIPPFLVARKISRRGTEGQPWLEETLQDQHRNIEKTINDSVERAISKAFRRR